MSKPLSSTLKVEYRHIPVLLKEAVDALSLRKGDCCVDCTLGGASHALALAQEVGSEGLIVGIDRDLAAIAAATKAFQTLAPEVPRRLLHGSFKDLDQLLVDCALPGAQGFLFDLGVSSPQLDQAQRGFSYAKEAPLDMRMDPGNQSKTAAEVVNNYDEADLARILSAYGEERYAKRIARKIVERRAQRPLHTTLDLASLVQEVYPAKARNKRHPARKTFQAIRIEVNGELDALQQGLEAAIRWVEPGGVLAVITYHSLEDRLVSHLFSQHARGCTCPPDLPVCVCGNMPILDILTKHPITPSPQEVMTNPRSRSAKLRVAKKRSSSS